MRMQLFENYLFNSLNRKQFFNLFSSILAFRLNSSSLPNFSREVYVAIVTSLTAE